MRETPPLITAATAAFDPPAGWDASLAPRVELDHDAPHGDSRAVGRGTADRRRAKRGIRRRLSRAPHGAGWRPTAPGPQKSSALGGDPRRSRCWVAVRLDRRGPWAERDQLVARAEPVAGEAHDVAPALSVLLACLGLPTFRHPVDALFQRFLRRQRYMPSQPRASITLI